MQNLKEKILVVDDDPGSLRFLEVFLMEKGYKVYAASGGALALEIVKSTPIDLILLDIMMPEIDGFEICRRLKTDKRTCDIPIIFISTMHEISDQVKAFQVGGVDYITKPLKPEEVLARLNTHLSLKNIRKQLQEQNIQLQQEIQVRQKAEEALQSAHDELELRVKKRTEELANTNNKLHIEMKERTNLEKAILEISESEQRRIGNDLHDGLGQLLTGIAFMTNTLYKQLQVKSQSDAQNAQKIVDLVNDGISLTSRLARGLYPVTLQKGGLVSALDELASNTRDLYKISCICNCNNTIDFISEEMAIHLYRIAQEAVNNAIKHSKSKRISIDLSYKANRIMLIVKDDGIGFSEDKLKKYGLGIQIMNYRAKIIGATIKMETPSDRGTRVICSLEIVKNN